MMKIVHYELSPIFSLYNVVGVLCTARIQGGQDRAFQFRCGLANYKAHGDPSWLRPLLGGNSPTSNDLILKMDMCYKGWVESSRSSCGEGEKWISYPLPKG
jgi:hypothetical protein